MAPSSIVLNGYTLTSLPSTASSPTKTSSPSTTPSSQRTLARRLLARPITVPRTRAPGADVGVVVHDAALEVGAGEHAARSSRAPTYSPRRQPASTLQPAPMTAGPTTWASGETSAPSPSHTPSEMRKPGMSSSDALVEHVLVGAAGRPRACRRPPSSPRRRRRTAACRRPAAREHVAARSRPSGPASM